MAIFSYIRVSKIGVKSVRDADNNGLRGVFRNFFAQHYPVTVRQDRFFFLIIIVSIILIIIYFE